jgi:hypothetical protein
VHSVGGDGGKPLKWSDRPPPLTLAGSPGSRRGAGLSREFLAGNQTGSNFYLLSHGWNALKKRLGFKRQTSIWHEVTSPASNNGLTVDQPRTGHFNGKTSISSLN